MKVLIAILISGILQFANAESLMTWAIIANSSSEVRGTIKVFENSERGLVCPEITDDMITYDQKQSEVKIDIACGQKTDNGTVLPKKFMISMIAGVDSGSMIVRLTTVLPIP